MENNENSTEEYKMPVWKKTLTTMEWLAEQPDMIQTTYNGWIRLMTKCAHENRYSDKQYRLMPYHIFSEILDNFLTHFQLKSEEDFLGQMQKLLLQKGSTPET